MADHHEQRREPSGQRPPHRAAQHALAVQLEEHLVAPHTARRARGKKNSGDRGVAAVRFRWRHG